MVAAGGAPLRIVIGDPAFFEIEVYGEQSEHLMSIRYPEGLRQVEKSRGEGYLAELRELRASMPNRVIAPDGSSGRVRGAPYHFAPTLPGFIDLHYDSEGFIWAGAYVAPWETGASALVFSDSGDLLGSVVLPERFKVHEIGDDYVLGVWQDELDVEFIRMYGLQRH
jgi:hypothetical protein